MPVDLRMSRRRFNSASRSYRPLGRSAPPSPVRPLRVRRSMFADLVVHLERRRLVDADDHRLAQEAAVQEMPHYVLATVSSLSSRVMT